MNINNYISYWRSLIIESNYNDEPGIDVNEKNLSKVQKFLNDNTETIQEGMKFIEDNYFKLGFKKGL